MRPQALISALLAVVLAASMPLTCYAQTRIEQIDEIVPLEVCANDGGYGHGNGVSDLSVSSGGSSDPAGAVSPVQVVRQDSGEGSNQADGEAEEDSEVADGSASEDVYSGSGSIGASGERYVYLDSFSDIDLGDIAEYSFDSEAQTLTARGRSGVYYVLRDPSFADWIIFWGQGGWSAEILLTSLMGITGMSNAGTNTQYFTYSSSDSLLYDIVDAAISDNVMLSTAAGYAAGNHSTLSTIALGISQLDEHIGSARVDISLLSNQLSQSYSYVQNIAQNLRILIENNRSQLSSIQNNQSVIAGWMNTINANMVSELSIIADILLTGTSGSGGGSFTDTESGKSLLDNIADIASAFSGDKSILGSIFNIEDMLSGGINIGGGITYEQMVFLLLQSHSRSNMVDENSIYGFLKSLRDWSDDYQTTLFKNVSRYLFEANDEESVSVTAYLRMIYQLLKGKQYSSTDAILAKLDALYDALSNIEPSQPTDLFWTNAKLDAIIALLAADAAIDLVDAFLGNLDLGSLLGKIGGLGDVLASAFPFCLIFMVIAVLEVLAADPVTPSFDFAVPIGLNGETYHCAIDLVDYDGLATLVRYLLFAAYCIGLFLSTKDHIYSPSGGE